MWTKPIFNLYVRNATKQLCNIFAQITRLNFLINNVNLTSLLNQITYFKENSSIIDNLKFIPDAEISKKDQKGDEELIRKPWGAAQAKDWVLIPKSEAETGYNAPSQRSLRRKAPCTTSATPSLSIEDIREAVAAEVARAQATPEGAASTARGRGRGRARGWGRGRWINFGFYLPHPGPYTPFCRAHREAGCPICMYFCPSSGYMDPQEKGWSIQNWFF